jgi:two-component system OmpR family response regulator
MTTACLCEIERGGLAAALALRGIAWRSVHRHAVGGAQLPAGSVLVAGLAPGEGLHAVRAAWRGPLLVVLPGSEQAHIADALDAGADDAVTERAHDPLVAARVAALIRRCRADHLLEFGSLTIDPLARRASRAGRALGLLPREFAVLLHLVRRAGETVPRAALLEAVCGIGFDPGTNVIEVHVSRLRAKLDGGASVPMLLTERGRGYRLVKDDICPIEACAAAG